MTSRFASLGFGPTTGQTAWHSRGSHPATDIAFLPVSSFFLSFLSFFFFLFLFLSCIFFFFHSRDYCRRLQKAIFYWFQRLHPPFLEPTTIALETGLDPTNLRWGVDPDLREHGTPPSLQWRMEGKWPGPVRFVSRVPLNPRPEISQGNDELGAASRQQQRDVSLCFQPQKNCLKCGLKPRRLWGTFAPSRSDAPRHRRLISHSRRPVFCM